MPEAPARTAVRLRIGLLLGLVLLIVAAYWGAPGNGFRFDDTDNIVDHPPVHMSTLSLDGLAQAAAHPFLARRPLPSITFAVDWWRGEGSARPFQWTNLTLHALVALTVFALLRTALRLAGRGEGRWADLAAFAAAGLWAVHPIQAQAVTYIVQRMTLMAALFALLSVICYVRARGSARPLRWYAGALLAFAAGAASKENAWITPALWWLAEFGLCRKGPLLSRPLDRALFALPFVLVLAVLADLWSGNGPLSQYVEPGYAAREFTLEQRLLTQPRVVLFHVSQLAWPWPDRFSLEHDFALSRSLLDPASTAGAVVLLGVWCLGGLGALFRPAARALGFWMLWIPLTLAVESSVIPLEMVFEHRMYLPSVGFAGLLALAFARLSARPARRAAAAAGALVLVPLLVATQARVAIWGDELALYREAIRHAPGSGRAWTGYGEAALRRGDVAGAEAALRRAVELVPSESAALEKLGVILLDRGDVAGADRLLRRALELRGGHHSILNHLGELYMRTEAFEAARDMFAKAVDTAPREPAYLWNLALALERTGACETAREIWLRYLAAEGKSEERALVQAHLDEGGRCGKAP